MGQEGSEKEKQSLEREWGQGKEGVGVMDQWMNRQKCKEGRMDGDG